MAKRRITDIARERGLDPNEVAARLFEAGVAARALAGSRPSGAGAKAAAQTAAPARTATGRKVAAAAPAPAPAHPQAMRPPAPPRAPADRPPREARPAR